MTDRQSHAAIRRETLDALDVLTEYVRESAEKRRYGKTMAQEALRIVRAALEVAAMNVPAARYPHDSAEECIAAECGTCAPNAALPRSRFPLADLPREGEVRCPTCSERQSRRHRSGTLRNRCRLCGFGL